MLLEKIIVFGVSKIRHQIQLNLLFNFFKLSEASLRGLEAPLILLGRSQRQDVPNDRRCEAYLFRVSLDQLLLIGFRVRLFLQHILSDVVKYLLGPCFI